MATEVYLVRHGETMFNQLNKVQGWADSPLTVKGINDLKVTARHLSQVHFDKMYSSDLKRAIDTVHLIAGENKVSKIGKIKKLPAFREVFFGSFEGDDINETWEKIAIAGGMGPETDIDKIIATLGMKKFRQATKEADPRHLAENEQELEERMQQAIKQLGEETKDLGRVLIVSHGDFIKTLGTKYWINYNDKNKIEFPANGSVSRGILHDNDRFEIVDYNVKSSDLVNL
ncbi:histidine phosphatase family protein [Lactobacillus sp. PV037]|uniref:histidine phosphatase family protein n=1 Tax=unclassified Lactobacillus TaxID=2620435 RepID=UPI00223F8F5B|nr:MULTISPECIES: histidine phosphatase family protein [unclassified Lactobacillus]QNQ81850.1 histidine phosphatase family protein [Lactobacillus sp. PV012]QNQ84111.1 histidine phosphatase family protein [Lactobacillus sp. PV037]